MSYEVLGISVLWVFLFGYLIVASIDFGAGFFSYYSTITGKRHLIQNIIERYLSPVWEVTNVFLVFFFVGIVGFFPDTAYYYGTACWFPGALRLCCWLSAALIMPSALTAPRRITASISCFTEQAACLYRRHYLP